MTSSTRMMQQQQDSAGGAAFAHAHSSDAQRQSNAAAVILVILALIAFDQFTKAGALIFTSSAKFVMTDRSFGLAWHLHEANAWAPLTAMAALIVIGLMCLLPVPAAVKVLWVSAGISNHCEMLLRPGTMDFLAVRLGSGVWVANVADIYFVLGIVVLFAWTVKRIRSAKGWREPL
ncbi:MAG TPA: signal peptidase II [Planctomycetota bacterium]|nr:signal peptidase II [Planctomycetota bacterium]